MHNYNNILPDVAQVNFNTSSGDGYLFSHIDAVAAASVLLSPAAAAFSSRFWRLLWRDSNPFFIFLFESSEELMGHGTLAIS